MADIEKTRSKGKLVALEGEVDVISMQLRLLPPSQKILVLPSVQASLPPDAEDGAFDARTFIRSVHDIFTERTETARAFLRTSTPAHPKLVLMNGGSASATATCILKIRETLTHGELEEAERIFKDIVRGGVDDLMKENRVPEQGMEIADTSLTHVSTNAQPCMEVEVDAPRTLEEPIASHGEAHSFPSPGHPGSQRLSRLSNSLEPITVRLLQPKENDFSSRAQTAADRDEVTSTKHASLTIPKSPRTIRTVVSLPPPPFNLQDKLSAFGPWSSQEQTPSTAKTSYSRFLSTESDDEDEDEYEFEPDLTTLVDEFCSSAPNTPRGVVFGEARLVPQVKPATGVRPLDLYGASSAGLPKEDPPTRVLRSAKSESILGRRPADWNGESTVFSRIQDFEIRPSTATVQPSNSTLHGLSRPVSASPIFAPTCAPRTFVDRGTDAEETTGRSITENTEKGVQAQTFKPIFPAIEDLVIEFVDYNFDNILNDIVRCYKSGSYPILQHDASVEVETSTTPSSPVNDANVEINLGRRPSHMTTRTDDSGYDTRHEYDPYVSPQTPIMDVHLRNPKVRASNRANNEMCPVEASPSAMSRPSSSDGVSDKYVAFSPAISANNISVQNSLRALFNEHFPSTNGFSQYYYSAAPGIDRIWKPVFGTDFIGAGNESCTVDQILAFGCEEGVESNIQAQLTGQLESLGMKRNGVGRSGKVDIKYLIANIMQSYTSSADNQTAFNPLSDPKFLATLLIPQIETYVAANPTSRFLILQHSWDHLSTVLELQRLLGSNLLQVAGILDSLACEPCSITSHSNTPSSTNPLSNDAVELRNKQQRATPSHTQQSESPSSSHTSTLSTTRTNLNPKPSVSFSKANLVLPSAATESETFSFLTSITHILTEKSTFYKPEPEPKPIVIERPPLPPTPTTPTSTRRDRERDREPNYPPPSYRAPKEVRNSKISRLTGTTLSTPRQTRYSYTPSIVSSIRTTHTTATERGRREDKEWENFYIGEEDSDDDEYDRMILGRSMAKIVPEARKPFATGGKRSTKKALKWLGLA